MSDKIKKFIRVVSTALWPISWFFASTTLVEPSQMTLIGFLATVVGFVASLMLVSYPLISLIVVIVIYCVGVPIFMITNKLKLAPDEDHLLVIAINLMDGLFMGFLFGGLILLGQYLKLP